MTTMNAGATSTGDDTADYESDTGTNSDDSEQYYQTVLAAEIGGDGEGGDGDFSDQDLTLNYHQLPNGFVENGVALLDFSDEDDENEGEPEEETVSERVIETAFREDERRRLAPLPAENSVRIIEAMRGISFASVAPAWVSQIPEELWIDRLRRLQRPDTVASAETDN